MAAAEVDGSGRVRVVVVDDMEDIRMLLRLQLARDDRFELVGEGADGEEAIALAEAHHPDLMVLDRRMPKLSGVEAIPEIRRRSPETGILLYTAQHDEGEHQAALAAGALGVLDKTAGAVGFVDTLIDTLLRDGGGAGNEGTIEIRVGPVPAAAARAWIANTAAILDALEAHPDVLDDPVPADVMALFRGFLERWAAVAAEGEEFRWAARAGAEEVARAVSYWAAVDDMSDEQLARLGVGWAPPEGEAFFKALTSGVLAAMRRHDDTRRLAARLDEQWSA